MRSLFSIDDKLQYVLNIERKMSESSFWNNQKEASNYIQSLKSTKSIIEPYLTLKKSIIDDIELLNMADEYTDGQLITDINNNILRYGSILKEIEINTYLCSKEDRLDALLSINSGAGGVDAMDWANDLKRMYTRWLDKNDFKYSIIDELEGEAGIKKVVIQVNGNYAFGKLKSEIGVHRICHISEFDSNHKKQTSFASVDVTPIYPEVDIKINDNDIDIDTFCSGGPGGQNVNKVASAVRIRHIPTNLVVKCQSQRSQEQNKKIAMQLLLSKLQSMEEQSQRNHISNQYDKKVDVAFGHQIRTYVLEPYQLVKDHRTEYQTGNVQHVLDGNGLTEFIEAYLRMSKI